jgi:hypothetical protein
MLTVNFIGWCMCRQIYRQKRCNNIRFSKNVNCKFYWLVYVPPDVSSKTCNNIRFSKNVNSKFYWLVYVPPDVSSKTVQQYTLCVRLCVTYDADSKGITTSLTSLSISRMSVAWYELNL